MSIMEERMETKKVLDFFLTAGSWPLDPKKPLLVFIHGAGGSHHLWDEQIKGLADAANVIALDLPGHGQSGGAGKTSVSDYAAEVAGLVRELGAPKTIPVGLSMGGGIAQQLLLDYPELFIAGILISTGSRLKVMPAIIETAEKNFGAFVDMIGKFSISPKTDPALIKAVQDATAQNSPKVVADDFRACDAFDVMGRLSEIKLPVLVVSAEDDKLTPPKYADFLEKSIAGAKRVHIMDAGHMVPAEKPEEVNAAIRDFLAALGL